MSKPTKRLMTVNEVADHLRVSRSHVIGLILSRELPASNVGGLGKGTR